MFKKFLAALLAFVAAAAIAAVDVNKADAAALDGIKGIGPGIAGKILDERKKGSFKDWDDLITRVQGIGDAECAGGGVTAVGPHQHMVDRGHRRGGGRGVSGAQGVGRGGQRHCGPPAGWPGRHASGAVPARWGMSGPASVGRSPTPCQGIRGAGAGAGGRKHKRPGIAATAGADAGPPDGRDWCYLVSLKTTCFFTIGSYFFISIRSRWA